MSAAVSPIRSFCRVQAAAGRAEATIYLYGGIGPFDVSAGSLVAALREIPPDVQTLHVRVNSPGGSVDDARAMSTALYEWPGKVVAHVDGLAASSAAFLLLSADEIVMSEGSFQMLHKPWGLTIGNDDEHDQAAALLRKYEAGLVDSYVRRTGVDARTIRAWMEDETWFDANEAVAVGLADRVVQSVPELEGAAALAEKVVLNLSSFRHAPAALLTKFANKESFMSLQNPAVKPPPPAPQVHAAAVVSSPPVDPVMAERERVEEIYNIVHGLHLPLDFATRAIKNGVRLDLFRTMALEENYHRDQANNIRGNHMSANFGDGSIHTPGSYNPGYGGEEKTTQAFAEAIYAKLFKPSTPNLDERFRGRKLVEMVQAYHFAMGKSSLGNDLPQIAGNVIGLMKNGGFGSGGVRGAAQHSTDFPAILANALNKRLLEIYMASPAALKAIARERSAPDFRSLMITRLSEYPTLDPIAEGAPITSGTLSDFAGSYGVSPYGRIVGLTRVALVNDDLGAFGQLTQAGGQASIDREATLLVGVLTANAGMGATITDDTLPIFDAAHANLAAVGAPIDDATLSEARLAMRLQKGIGGVQIINAIAKYLVVPAALETEAQKYMASISPGMATDVNVFSGKLELVVEPRLDAISATRWYLAADPTVYACLEIAYLDGAARPRVESETEFDTDSFRMKCVLDVGAGAVDFRGMFMNPGAPVIP